MFYFCPLKPLWGRILITSKNTHKTVFLFLPIWNVCLIFHGVNLFNYWSLYMLCLQLKYTLFLTKFIFSHLHILLPVPTMNMANIPHQQVCHNLMAVLSWTLLHQTNLSTIFWQSFSWIFKMSVEYKQII